MGSSSGQSEYHRYDRPTMPVFKELISVSLDLLQFFLSHECFLRSRIP